MVTEKTYHPFFMHRLLIILVFLVSCSSVKRVLRDKEKFDKVAEAVVRSGKYCIIDTITVTRIKDSVIYKDSLVKELVNVPCKDFDSIIGRARISVRSGVLTYKSSDSIIKQTIIKKIRDLSAEQVLRSDVAVRDSIINVREKEILSLQIANSEQKDETRKWKWRFWGLIAALVLLVVGKITIKTYLKRL